MTQHAMICLQSAGLKPAQHIALTDHGDVIALCRGGLVRVPAQGGATLAVEIYDVHGQILSPDQTLTGLWPGAKGWCVVKLTSGRFYTAVLEATPALILRAQVPSVNGENITFASTFDGTKIVTCTDNGMVHVYNGETRALQVSFEIAATGQPGCAGNIVCVPDGAGQRVVFCDVATGAMQGFGSSGWNTLAGQFIEPNVVQAIDDDHFIVFDVATGRLIEISALNPHVVRFGGGSGPRLENTNRNYAIAADTTGIWASAAGEAKLLHFNKELIADTAILPMPEGLDKNGESQHAHTYLDGCLSIAQLYDPNTASPIISLPINSGKMTPNGHDMVSRSGFDSPANFSKFTTTSPPPLAQSFLAGSERFHLTSDANLSQFATYEEALNIFRITGLWPDFRMSFSVIAHDCFFWTAPHARLIVAWQIDAATGALQSALFPTPDGVWTNGLALVSRDGVINLASLATEAKSIWARLATERQANLHSSLQSIFDCFAPFCRQASAPAAAKEFRKGIDLQEQNWAWKQFFLASDALDEVEHEVSRAFLKRLALLNLADCLPSASKPGLAVSLSVASMMMGASILDHAKLRTQIAGREFLIVGDSANDWVGIHAPEAMMPGACSYASSTSLETSQFRFGQTSSEPAQLRGVAILAHAPQDFPSAFEIYVLERDAITGLISAEDLVFSAYKDTPPAFKIGPTSAVYSFDTPSTGREWRFVLKEGGYNNRIVFRGFAPLF